MLDTKTVGIISLEGQDLSGKVCVLDINVLAHGYRKPEYQFWKAVGGFGCKPFLSGRAVYAKSLAGNDDVRWSREDFIGIASDELVKQYFPDFK